jgi:ABC-type glycerol-3-phosphate transport system permease component
MAVRVEERSSAQRSQRTLTGYLQSRRFQERAARVVIYLLLIGGSVLVMLPFFWMVSTSLKRPGTEFTFPIEWIPNPPRWSNYPQAWTVLPFTAWTINTAVITFTSIIGNVFSSAVVGFGFARIKFPGRDVLFLLVLATLMLPYPSILVPLFLLYKNMGWIDTFKPIVVPTFFASSAFYVFLMRQFFKTIPMDLDDAARVDGCTTFGVFRYVALPLIRPALGIITVFSFMHHWNDFLGPLIFLSSMDKFPLALGLRYFQGQYRVEWTLLMAASLMVLSPCILLFFIAQKYYIQGIVVSGVKG